MYQKKSFIDEKGISHSHVQKGLQEGLYIVCPVLLSPMPIASAMKTQKTQQGTLITLNKQLKEISKLNTLISCTAQA